MPIRLFFAVFLLITITGGLTPPRSYAESSRTQHEELLDKAKETLLWFHALDTPVQNRLSPQTYREHISPEELIQAAALLHSFHAAEQTTLAERLLLILPHYRLTPEESFEVYDIIGDATLFELGDISTEALMLISTDANEFRTRQLNGAERVVLYQEPATALEVMKAIDVLSVVGRPVLVRHYLRKFLAGEYFAGTPAQTSEESAKIVETIGTQKLMQLAIRPEFVPLGKEAVAKIIDEAKKHWQDPERIAEALKETQWFDTPAPAVIPAQAGIQTEDVNTNSLAPRLRGGDGVVAPRIRPEALPALQVLWKGDQLSVQQVFEKLGTIEDEREADELTAILLSLRPDMKEALACALDSMNSKLRYHAARGLAASVTPQESFLLFTFLFDDYGVAMEEKTTVKNILQQRRIAIPSQEQAAAILFERATDYFERRRPLRINADGNVPFWTWKHLVHPGKWTDEESEEQFDEQIINWSEYDIETAYKRFAHMYYGQSMQVIPWASENRKVYQQMGLIAYFEYEMHLNATVYGNSKMAASLDSELIPLVQWEPVLQTSLEKERFYAATRTIHILGSSRNTDVLQSTNGKPRVLVQAVVAKDRFVRFAALEAIMKITATQSSALEPFAGSSLVAETLVWFSKSEGQSVMLSGHPQMATTNQTASLFLGLGYKTDVATSCRDLFALAAASPDVEVVVVDARTPQPPVAEFVQRMRQDARTAEIPIAILDTIDDRRQTADGSRGATAPLSLTYPRIASEESARWVRDDLFEKTGVHLAGTPAEQRLEQAKQALAWLREIKEAELVSGVKIYHFEDFDAVVLNALHSERRVKEGLDLAAVVKSPVLQSAIYDLAANVIYPMEIREYAGDAFEKSVQTFGILLRGAQIQRLYDRYNQSEFEPKESQELLGRLLDVVEKKAGE